MIALLTVALTDEPQNRFDRGDGDTVGEAGGQGSPSGDVAHSLVGRGSRNRR
jgi:hypothetical protein